MNKIHVQNLRKSIMNDRGSTMVETLVSFVVLMIILTIITGMVVFCSKLRMRAEDTARAMTEFNAQMYNTQNISPRMVTADESAHVDSKEYNENNIRIKSYVTGKQVEKDESDKVISSTPVPVFYLVTPESEKNTSSEEYGKDFLSLYNIEADSYAYISDDSEYEGYLLPKAIRFIHKNDR